MCGFTRIVVVIYVSECDVYKMNAIHDVMNHNKIPFYQFNRTHVIVAVAVTVMRIYPKERPNTPLDGQTNSYSLGICCLTYEIGLECDNTYLVFAVAMFTLFPFNSNCYNGNEC